MNFSNNQDNGVVNIVANYLRLLGINNITKNTVKEKLLTHLNYPNLLSMSDVLDAWNIDNMGLNIKSEQMFEIPTPFKSKLQMNSGEFITINKAQSDVTYLSVSEITQ